MQNDRRIYVAVLMGGVSSEREVSLHSGKAVAQGLRKAGFDVYEALVDDRSLSSLEGFDIDVAYIALHGEFGEDGGVQVLLEDVGIPYTGSGPESSRDAMDKGITKAKFSEVGVPTPAYAVLEEAPNPRGADNLFARLGPRVVVKPVCQGSSIGVEIADRRDFPAAIDRALVHDGRVVVESFVAGRELTVGIVGDRTLPIVEMKPHREFFDYTAKYQQGQTDYIVNPALPDGVAARCAEAAMNAFTCLGCRDIGRVDIMLDASGEIFVLEVNTIPGATDTSLVPKAAAAAGMDFPTLCRRLVEMALERSTAIRPI